MSTVQIAQAQIKQLADNYDKMEGLAKALHESPDLRAKFAADPAGTAKEVNGFEAPQGFGIHYTDDSNAMVPPEKQGAYVHDRLEIRVAHKSIAIVVIAD